MEVNQGHGCRGLGYLGECWFYPALVTRSREPRRLLLGEMHLSSLLKDKLQVCLADKEGEGSFMAGNSLCKDLELQSSMGCSENETSSGCGEQART